MLFSEELVNCRLSSFWIYFINSLPFSIRMQCEQQD